MQDRCSNTDLEWDFPRAHGNRSYGFKDAGVATFSGKIMPSLVREICQNSLDAVTDRNKPVRVEFERYDLAVEDIPGYHDIRTALGKALPYHFKKKSEAVDHLRRMYKLLGGGNSIPVLRASDFNTTGLGGAYEDEIGDWTRLTKIDGGATKGGVSAGSYGIGKNAPFASSELRMVFYRTLTNETEHGGRAAQGIIHLPAYATDHKKELSTQTLGIGYYGDRGDPKGVQHLPVPSIPILDELHLRKEVGTDIFVFGLYHQDDDWLEKVAVEVLESFLVAIYNNKLEVILSENGSKMVISRETLSHIVDKYRKSARNAASYYSILADLDAADYWEEDFHELGRLRLHMLAGTEVPFNRKVLVVRSTNMRIKQIDRLSGSLNFTGILELVGDDLNAYFRQLENPAHDGWEADRYTKDPKQAKQYIKELRSWVKDKVTKGAALTTPDKVRARGLSSNLRSGNRDVSDLIGLSSPENMPNTRKENSAGGCVATGDVAQSSAVNIIIERSGARPDSQGDTVSISGHGNQPRPRNERKRTKKKPRVRGSGSAAAEKGRSGGKAPRAVDVIFARVIQIGPRMGRLVLKVPWTIEHGSIMLHIVGENGAKYKGLQIDDVSSSSTEVVLMSNGDRIRFRDLPGETWITADITFAHTLKYALGISVYEDR